MFCTYACNGPHCFGFLQRYFVGTDLKESKALCGGFSVHGFVKIVVRASLDRGVKSLGRVGFESVESLGRGVKSLGRVGFESVESLGRGVRSLGRVGFESVESLGRGVRSLGRVGFESVESLGTVGARLITGVRSLGRVGFESVERLGRVGVESVVEPCKVVVACKVQVEKDDVC